MYNSVYLINATATKDGGALTILKAFLAEIENTRNNSVYYVFCGVDLNIITSGKIKLVKIKTSGFGIGGIKRLLWDLFGLYFYCKKNRIRADIIISFQNTGVFFPGVKQLIYYHQPIPLFSHRWKFYKKDEAILFFYKELYPLFIRLLINKNTEFVVQLEFIKKLFSEKFHISEHRIHVIVPEVNMSFESKIEKIALDKNKFHIFFPTNAFKYKNYDMLFAAISNIKIIAPETFNKIILHITLDKYDKKINQKLSAYDISKSINLLGTISYNEVISYYNSVNLLVFPSYIETLGLPLIEAAYFGLPVLAADMDYAHEVLKDYDGAFYLQYDDIDRWAKEMILIVTANLKFQSFKGNPKYNSWRKMLELSDTLIRRNVQ
jgi:glycosyltransferase involved in cell wall biosynthesis